MNDDVRSSGGCRTTSTATTLVALLVWGAWTAAIHAVARADFFVTPNLYEHAEGPGANAVPLFNAPRTIMMLYHADQLTGMRHHEISGITYRLINNLPGGYPIATTTWNNYEISLGRGVAPSAISSTIADNFIGPASLVRSGALIAPPFSWPVGTPPNPSPWGLELHFDTPFIYRGGHLAVLITHDGSNGLAGNNLINSSSNSTPNVGIDFRALTGVGFRNPTGDIHNFVPILRFTAHPVPIPEPAAAALWLLAVCSGSAIRHRRKVARGPW